MSRQGGVGLATHPGRWLGALASGVLFVLSFPGPDLGWLSWVALVPLLLALRGTGPSEAFRLGFVSGLVAFGGLMEWIRIFGLPAWVVLVAAMAGYLGAFAAGVCALAARYAPARPAAWLWIVPLTWVAVEAARSLGPLGFPWGLLGLTQHRTPALLAVAPVVGTFGISALIAVVNAAAASVIGERRVSLGAAAALALAAAAVAVANSRPVPLSTETRIVAAIQPNVPPRSKGDPSMAAALVNGLLQQTAEAAAAGAEIIVYPETAVPADLTQAPGLRSAIARSADGAVVVAGMFQAGPRNGVLVLDGEGRPLGQYAKRRLVPFGEAGVIPGDISDPVRTPTGTLALAICYESAFSDLIRPMVTGGADLIAILTNDGWFGMSAGPAQHAAQSALRAAETGRSVVRAANTGTSMLVRPDGTVAGSVPLGTPGVLVAAIPVGGPLTPFVRWGWMLGPMAVVGWLGAAVPLGVQAARRRPGAARALAAAVVVPAVPWALWRMLAPAAQWAEVLAAAAVVAASAVVGRGRLFNGRRAAASAALSLAATALLVVAMRAAYSQYGFEMRIGPQEGAWAAWGLRHLVRGFAVEVWLRGALFGAAAALGGWPLAMSLPALLGVALHLGLPQEILFWHLLTCVGYGAIRLWTRDAVGLGPARGLGDAVILGLAQLR